MEYYHIFLNIYNIFIILFSLFKATKIYHSSQFKEMMENIYVIILKHYAIQDVTNLQCYPLTIRPQSQTWTRLFYSAQHVWLRHGMSQS